MPDGFDTSNPNVNLRIEKSFSTQRRFTDSQLLILHGAASSTISLDKSSIFGIRCPELLKIIN